MTTAKARAYRIYEGAGDDLADQVDKANRIMLLPPAPPAQRDAESTEHIRIMWGQRMIDDLLAGRYRALVCAVNAHDNSHGIIGMLAEKLPTSQWTPQAITDHARHFAQKNATTVIKYDMDRVKVLGLLRPADRPQLTINDLAAGFRTISAMLSQRPDRLPVASVCFLGARANKLVDAKGNEPSFEAVLSSMYQSGFRGDVYPSPVMWESLPGAVFPRYPFPDSFTALCNGGF